MKKHSFDESKTPRWLVILFAFILFGLIAFICFLQASIFTTPKPEA